MKTMMMGLVALMAMGSMAFAGPVNSSAHRSAVVVKKAKKNKHANRGKHLGATKAKKGRKNGEGKASSEGKANAAPQGTQNGVGLGGGTQ